MLRRDVADIGCRRAALFCDYITGNMLYMQLMKNHARRLAPAWSLLLAFLD